MDDDASDGADCADPDCRSTATCDEYCGNGVDNGNGLVDCLDTVYCAREVPCTETSCTNGLDDDGRGDVDCTDEDCSRDPACFEICDNGVDDNHDGLLDCRDFRCFGRAPCNGGGDDDDDDSEA